MKLNSPIGHLVDSANGQFEGSLAGGNGWGGREERGREGGKEVEEGGVRHRDIQN